MSASLQNNHLCKVTLLGNLVKKPTIRYLANPILAVAELTIATHSKWFEKQSQQYKEWTHFHTIKVIGDIVEQALLFADKGDVILIHGYLLNSKKNNREIIHANFAQAFNKGYAQSINLIQISATLQTPFKLVKTESNKQLGQSSLLIEHQVISPINDQIEHHRFERPVHVWGKQAEYLYEKGQVGDNVIIEGKLSYLQNAEKSQFIEAKQVVLISK
jgi:single-stranded DNA-binding protein